jgi:hypothetical protein
MTAVDDLNKGDKIHRHLSLYARYDKILDGICEQFNCSRSDAVEALLADYAAGVRDVPLLKEDRKEPE